MTQSSAIDRRYRWAYHLSLFTIGYNLLEGGVSVAIGASDETLALFGFGVDSVVEVMSGIGITHMILRMKKNPIEHRDRFEVSALRVTGTAFYLLVVGLIVGSFMSILSGSEPESTFFGIVISIISICTMYFLYRSKLKVGDALQNEAIISDAHCTKTCFYLSFILLLSSSLYELLNIPYVDALGALGIAWYAFREGREAFVKANSKQLSCQDNCS